MGCIVVGYPPRLPSFSGHQKVIIIHHTKVVLYYNKMIQLRKRGIAK